MNLSFNKIGDEFHSIIHDDKGKELGNAFASLSNNSQFWKLEGICIPEEKDRGKDFGSDLLNYVREQLWEKQKLPKKTPKDFIGKMVSKMRGMESI